MMYKKILVAVDGSATSKIALEEAINLAKDQSSFLRVIHVVDNFYINWSAQPINPQHVADILMASGVEVIKSVDADIQQTGFKNYETKLVKIERTDHRIYEKIIDEANAWPADLIVIGTHGRKGVHRFLLGSVAEGVVRSSSIPVLLIRTKSIKR